MGLNDDENGIKLYSLYIYRKEIWSLKHAKALTHNTAYLITIINEERIQVYATKYIKYVLLIIYTAPAKRYLFTCKYKFHLFI